MVISRKIVLLFLPVWIFFAIIYTAKRRETIKDQEVFIMINRSSTAATNEDNQQHSRVNKINNGLNGQHIMFDKMPEHYSSDKAKNDRKGEHDAIVNGLGRGNGHDTINMNIVVFNRLSKCGSTTLFKLVEQVSNENNFTFVNDHNNKSTAYFNDEQIANYIESFPKPVFYVRHMSYINFTAYGKEHPVYIQMLRDPVERAISHYYYYDFHFGQHKGISLEKCLVFNSGRCGLLKPGSMLTQFCDTHTRQSHKCTIELTKQTIEKDYIFVGITEYYPESMKAFAKLLPSIFPKNMMIVKRNSAEEATGSVNPRPPEEFLKFLAKKYKKDYEVYHFAKQLFYKKLAQMDIHIPK